MVDLRAVDFMTCAGIGALVRASRYARAHGGDIELWARSGGTVDRILTLAKIPHKPRTGREERPGQDQE